MTLNRLWAACLLVPAALLLDSTPASASPNDSNARVVAAATRSSGRTLPRGVHRKKNGRYTHEICEENGSFRCLARHLLPADYVPNVSPISVLHGEAATPPATAMGPSNISAAYHLATLPPGTGTIVAIVDGPDYYAAADLAGYRKGYNLPALPTCPAATNGGLPIAGGTPCFAAVDETGALYTPKSKPTSAGDEDGDLETALDMDMISAACPACSILLVQMTGQFADADNGTGTGDIQAAVQAASKLGAAAISISLGGPESTDPLILGPKDPTGWSTTGHLVFAASGDFGFDTETFCGAEEAGCGDAMLTTPSYPASAPDIIAVGGTALYNANNAGTYTESVWDDGDPNGQDATTSGCSTEFPALPWQTANTNLGKTDCKMRATADLSAAAEYSTSLIEPVPANTDIVVYSTLVGGFTGGIEGTSASSPMVAAIFARLGLTTTMTASVSGDSLGWPYLPANAGGFNDVTVGTDDTDAYEGGVAQCTGANLLLCQAGVGWDGPTGVGTPNGAKLLALVGGTPVSDAGPGVPTGDASVSIEDGGNPPSNIDGGGNTDTSSGSSSSGCSCTTVGGTAANGLGAGGFLLGLAALVSRAARRRRSS